MTILHLSFDVRPTPNHLPSVVRSLVDASRGSLGALIVSLRRVTSPLARRVRRVSDTELEIDHWGLPFGILMRRNLQKVARTILEAGARGLIDLSSVDAVHAHKLTFEGIAAAIVARQLGRPLVVSLRGTDPAVLRFRPDLRPLARAILKQSSVVYYIAPSIRDAIRRRVGSAFYESTVAGKLVFLPNGVPVPSPLTTMDGFVPGRMMTVFRMESMKAVRNKNVRRLFRALSLVRDPQIRLCVVGDGPCRPVVERWARRRGVGGRVDFVGFVANRDMGARYRKAEAFLLPSLSETFGLVYAEALLHGTPVLYAASTGFDGMFDDVGVAVNPRSVRSIAEGIRTIHAQNAGYREAICRLADTGAFEVLGPGYSPRVYPASLEKVQ
jgi:glycosyltransferase involved in cell wall biosynthesis